jgi:hypothetical protein
MSDVAKTIEAVWKIESTRLIAAIARVTHDIGIAEELAQGEKPSQSRIGGRAWKPRASPVAAALAGGGLSRPSPPVLRVS